MIAVVCPFSRPSMVENLAANAFRQRFRDFVLVVVENGNAVGCWPTTANGSVVLRCSDAHQSSAKNVGLDWARKASIRKIAIFDDDDWYGCDWLTNIDSALSSGKLLVGQRQHYVELSDGSFALAHYHSDLRRGQSLHGPTLAYVLPDTPITYRRIVADELSIQEQLSSIGYVSTPLPAGEYVYRRHGGSHAWDVSDDQFMAQKHVCRVESIPGYRTQADS